PGSAGPGPVGVGPVGAGRAGAGSTSDDGDAWGDYPELSGLSGRPDLAAGGDLAGGRDLAGGAPPPGADIFGEVRDVEHALWAAASDRLPVVDREPDRIPANDPRSESRRPDADRNGGVRDRGVRDGEIWDGGVWDGGRP
ncbi:MAG: hypothetical protein ACQSGP_26105, partial [Frankia sp.]